MNTNTLKEYMIMIMRILRLMYLILLMQYLMKVPKTPNNKFNLTMAGCVPARTWLTAMRKLEPAGVA